MSLPLTSMRNWLYLTGFMPLTLSDNSPEPWYHPCAGFDGRGFGWVVKLQPLPTWHYLASVSRG